LLICGNFARSVSTLSVEIPTRELAFREKRGGFSVTLKRNCSISPAGFALVLAALALFALAIGTGFAAAGAWLILPFAGLEALLLAGAFLLTARRANDYERIELASRRLTVEVAEARRTARYELDARRAVVRLERSEGHGARVLLAGPQGALELGRHLDCDARVALAAELNKRLRI
jgi:uncharacterized membrane protein